MNIISNIAWIGGTIIRATNNCISNTSLAQLFQFHRTLCLVLQCQLTSLEVMIKIKQKIYK